MVDSFDAVEVVPARSDIGVLISCEHASERLPAPWQWPPEDARLLGTHWALDLGAAALTRRLAERMGAAAVLARFSRLLIDPNRPLDSDTLFRSDAEGEPVRLNQGLSEVERARRIACWQRYHDALAEQANGRQGQALLAVHSFTPVYEGRGREVAVGVLFDRDETLAHKLLGQLSPLAVEMRLNEPYSGRAGLIYSAQHHADRAGMRAVEIEVRQDLIERPDFRDALIAQLASFDWAP